MDTIRNRVGEVYEPFKVRFLEREIHALADDEVLVRVRASAICGSDLQNRKRAASFRSASGDHRA